MSQRTSSRERGVEVRCWTRIPGRIGSAYLGALIFSLIVEISLTQACLSLWDMSKTVSLAQWKW